MTEIDELTKELAEILGVPVEEIEEGGEDFEMISPEEAPWEIKEEDD